MDTNCSSEKTSSTPCANLSQAHFSSRPTNENTISILLPPMAANSAAQSASQAVVMIEPQPLKLKIESSTDWPTVVATSLVGIGSILTTLFVGRLTYVNQRIQIQSATANFRNNWQIDLREAAAKFLSLLATINWEIESNPNFLAGSESNKIFGELIEKQSIIELMLDPTKSYAIEIRHLAGELMDLLRQKDIEKMSIVANKLIDKVNYVLEQTWVDIQKDLNGKGKRL